MVRSVAALAGQGYPSAEDLARGRLQRWWTASRCSSFWTTWRREWRKHLRMHCFKVGRRTADGQPQTIRCSTHGYLAPCERGLLATVFYHRCWHTINPRALRCQLREQRQRALLEAQTLLYWLRNAFSRRAVSFICNPRGGWVSPDGCIGRSALNMLPIAAAKPAAQNSGLWGIWMES